MATPDLTPADTWLAARSATDRKRRGQWPTPWWVCEAVVDRLAPDLPARPLVVDPACGDGRWLLAVARRVPGARLIGLDLDPLAIAAARETLRRAGVEATLEVADGLAEGAVPPCDAVVGNPPFVRPQHLDRDYAEAVWARFPVATDKVDLSACFVQRALDRAPRVALVLPGNLLSLQSFAAVRARLLQAGVDGVFRLPKDAFPATVHTVAVLAGPTDRRVAGDLGPDGFGPLGTLAVSPLAWSVDGPLPALPGRPLGERVTLHMGVVCGDYDRYVHPGRRFAEDRPTCRGRDVTRWEIADRGEFLRYLPEEMLARKPYVAPKHAGLFDVPRKIVLAGTSGTVLRAAMDEGRRFPLDSCYVIHPRAADVDLYGVLGLLLSRPVGDWYAARFRAARVKGVEVARIPAPERGWDRIAEAARARDEAGLEAAVRAAYAATG